MGRDIFLKILDDEGTDNFWFVVWDRFIGAFVEGQGVTAGTCTRKSYWGHVLATGRAAARRQSFCVCGEEDVLVFVTDAGSGEFCVAVGPWSDHSSSSMAIRTIQLNHGSIGTSPYALHVNGVVHQNGARIFGALAECGEFGVAKFETANVRGIAWRTVRVFQICVTFGATLIASRADDDASAMFDVAGGTLGHVGLQLRVVMNRSIVASEAGAVHGSGRKFPCFLEMADGALFFEDRMGAAHPPARIDPGIARNSAPDNPPQGKQRYQHGQEEFRALVGCRPREIVQVDALRQLFCCASPRHFLYSSRAKIRLLIAKRHYGVNRSQNQQGQRKRDVQQQPSMQPVVQTLLPQKLARFIANFF